MRYLRSLGAGLLITFTLALSGPLAAKPPTAAPTTPLPVATPESQGMSSERLARGRAEIQRFLDEGKHAGAVSLVVRHGRSSIGRRMASATSRPGSRWRRTRSSGSTRCRRS